MQTNQFDSYYVQTVIKGGENLEIYKHEAKATRKVMSLPLLKLLGHEIYLTNWSSNSKQVLWTACTLAFFGSFRMGELLPQKTTNNCLDDTLLWNDVKMYDTDHILVNVKMSKCNKSGEFVDIFGFEGEGVCPVKAIKELKKSIVHANPNKPVFMFETGICLTLRNFNETVRSLLEPHLGQASSQISGHSFRAGIPAVLAKFPDISNSTEIMGWGRWKSSAYLVYTRLKVDQRRKIFKKITRLLKQTSL